MCLADPLVHRFAADVQHFPRSVRAVMPSQTMLPYTERFFIAAVAALEEGRFHEGYRPPWRMSALYEEHDAADEEPVGGVGSLMTRRTSSRTCGVMRSSASRMKTHLPFHGRRSSLQFFWPAYPRNFCSTTVRARLAGDLLCRRSRASRAHTHPARAPRVLQCRGSPRPRSASG